MRNELKVGPLLARLLVCRGLVDPVDAEAFLNPKLEDLHAPELLPDYAAARDILLDAREKRQLIFVHGDYDVDGVTSAALLTRFLSDAGCRVSTHVPHRMREGYGIHSSAVETAIGEGASVFLTCDCGSSAIAQIERARDAGLRVVVTDHHQVGRNRPRAHALINPHREDSQYPFSELSGVGVAFKLCLGLTNELKMPVAGYQRAFLDLVALGTIADLMPLVGENRILARHGLAQLPNSRKPGLQALMRQVGVPLGGAVSSVDVGFRLGPRLNAAGRVDDARIALDLLLTKDPAEAANLAAIIETKNDERKLRQARIVDEAEKMVLSDPGGVPPFIVVGSADWHSGVVGIVAGRLVERFYRPALVLAIDEGNRECRGSARSVPGFNLADAIGAFPDLMRGGGHSAAAGCGFALDDLEAVTNALRGYAAERLPPEPTPPPRYCDIEFDSGELTVEAVEDMQRMEPYGRENPEPSFYAAEMKLESARPTKDGRHVQSTWRDRAGGLYDCIGFNMVEAFADAQLGLSYDLVARASINEYRGRKQVKLELRDYRPAELVGNSL